ncbi:hypothetical protein MCOR13_010448 [Pyricularia oryzae]|nr:hypothetical protein MCOR13_010448 [Pyricularia oryzae]
MRVRHLQRNRASSSDHAESSATRGNAEVGWGLFKGIGYSARTGLLARVLWKREYREQKGSRDTVVLSGLQVLSSYLGRPVIDLKGVLFPGAALMALNHFWRSFEM